MKKTSRKQLKSMPESNTIVMVMKEPIFVPNDAEESNKLEIIYLRHPKRDSKSAFIFNPYDNAVQEILKYSQQNRSWFLGNSVNSDGKLFFSTPIDPLFLVLPYFCEVKMKSPFDQIVFDQNYPDSSKLLTIVPIRQLCSIADKTELNSLTVWKYNENKTLSWLKTKHDGIVNVLKAKQIHTDSSSAVSSTFIKSCNEEKSEESIIRYAHGLLSEYLPFEVSNKFLSFLNLSPIDDSISEKKRKKTDLISDEMKKLKKECYEKDIVTNLESSESKEKTPKTDSKKVALAKAAVGSKTISSFFKKK